MTIKLLLGGSPCTHWSIAQTKNRETEASGVGWELFRNYLIAKEKWQPDYFLYENNKSASTVIKDKIKHELGVVEDGMPGVPACRPEKDNGVRFTYINSALVSAQNRQRFYVTNFGDIEQPEDRGILLKDVLDGAVSWLDKSYTLDANYFRTPGAYDPKSQHSYSRHMAAEPINLTADGKGFALTSTYYKLCSSEYDVSHNLDRHQRSMISEPVCVVDMTQCCQGGGLGAKTGLYALPVDGPMCVREATKAGKATIEMGDCVDMTQPNSKTRRGRSMRDKCNCLVTSPQYYQYCEKLCYAVPCEWDENGYPTKAVSCSDGKEYPVYKVENGQITIKDKQYPFKLVDGYYIIRKLTVAECMRLQTVPEWYAFPVSNSQAYKMLGNGWTVEVIKYLLSHIPNIQNEEIEVLSMYDGMSCGQIALKEMGCKVVKYVSYEIDKYCIQTTQANFPDTVQMGDAFQVRDDDWMI